MGDMREDKKLIEPMRAIKMTVEDEERLRYKKLNAQIKRLEDIAAKARAWQERAREIKRRRTEWTDTLTSFVLQDNLLFEIADADLGGAK